MAPLSESLRLSASPRDSPVFRLTPGARRLASAQDTLDAALRESFNTPKAILILRRLITATNSYLAASRAAANLTAVKSIAAWITRILDIFGLSDDSRRDGWRRIGWGAHRAAGSSAQVRRERCRCRLQIAQRAIQDALSLARVLATFRDDVRSFAAASGTNYAALLERSDRLRDDELIDLGVQLEDREGALPLVSRVGSH
jgi:cysteinyl-tRNA synthetase